MRWQGRRGSSNVEDRRGRGGPAMVGGGIGGLGLVILVIYALLGGDPLALLQQQGGGGLPGVQEGGVPLDADADEAARFVSVVLADTEDVWRELFAAAGESYREPRLVLFDGQVQSACGNQSAAVGPFYCPGDGTVYLDTAFFAQLARRFGAPGDFAAAYVVAHEVGHHVQNVTGTMQKFDRQSQGLDERRRNALSIRLELQADCYAGVWGYFAQKRNLLEPGDLEEGLRAAAAVGDDTIMKRTQGYVVPDAMNHGTAEQRMRWFRTGLASGDPRDCDTFAVAQP